ncbi:Phosphatidylinositol 4-phosphate 3-kinase C2 domain-containing subunit beta [Bulinus truncatus]|nr:Phosphatidylinositol 4-phosphate 3-kinase C2 domain-containing subunit beta [Bulinus truncatus]
MSYIIDECKVNIVKSLRKVLLTEDKRKGLHKKKNDLLDKARVFGRSNIRPVAESRKAEIISFLQYLRSLSAEISECDLVYTFFHPMLRDEQEAEKNKQVTKLRGSMFKLSLNLLVLEPSVHHSNNAGSTGIKGEIKMSIQYKRDSLHVLVQHIRGLQRFGTALRKGYKRKKVRWSEAPL